MVRLYTNVRVRAVMEPRPPGHVIQECNPYIVAEPLAAPTGPMDQVVLEFESYKLRLARDSVMQLRDALTIALWEWGRYERDRV